MNRNQWISEILDRLQSLYLGDDGVLATVLASDGEIIDKEPLVADFGDVLPFVLYFGNASFVSRQLRGARKYLDKGLYTRNGRIQLFYNHDWLLGLLDIYRQTGDNEILELAMVGADHVGSAFFHNNLLIDEMPSAKHWRSLLLPASPFNGGYIELWIDLYKHTSEARYLDWSRQLAMGLSETPDFKKYSIFTRNFSARSSLLSSLIAPLATLKSRLFKDNTNLIWGLLALYRETKDERIRETILQWLAGYEKYFWNHGEVYLMLDTKFRGYEPSLKAAFSSLDLLCDLHINDVAKDRTLQLGSQIADFWLDQQWESGLFPEVPSGVSDHLDANVDFCVALYKLAALTACERYEDAAKRCSRATLEMHKMDNGYCLSVDQNGVVTDGRIIVKYQGLLTKLAMLPASARDFFDDEERLELLRDR